jgi:hypothetical protein
MKDAKPFVKREHSMTIPIYIVASAIDWVGGMLHLRDGLCEFSC